MAIASLRPQATCTKIEAHTFLAHAKDSTELLRAASSAEPDCRLRLPCHPEMVRIAPAAVPPMSLRSAPALPPIIEATAKALPRHCPRTARALPRQKACNWLIIKACLDIIIITIIKTITTTKTMTTRRTSPPLRRRWSMAFPEQAVPGGLQQATDSRTVCERPQTGARKDVNGSVKGHGWWSKRPWMAKQKTTDGHAYTSIYT